MSSNPVTQDFLPHRTPLLTHLTPARHNTLIHQTVTLKALRQPTRPITPATLTLHRTSNRLLRTRRQTAVLTLKLGDARTPIMLITQPHQRSTRRTTIQTVKNLTPQSRRWATSRPCFPQLLKQVVPVVLVQGVLSFGG